ncbi:hypothetical protein VH570_14425 [Sphingobium sp. HT1-2]|uniref:hypothetical protein n=1 Tax=Sphingobium sp. HT1-2 TaxID=3111640 RepID=UPI003C08E9A5
MMLPILLMILQAEEPATPNPWPAELLASPDGLEEDKHLQRIYSASETYLQCGSQAAEQYYRGDRSEADIHAWSIIECRPERAVAARAFKGRLNTAKSNDLELRRELSDLDFRFKERISSIVRWKFLMRNSQDP